MDLSIPAPAAKLLDLIGNTEAPRGYGTIYANKQGSLPKPLVTMTIDEVITAGPGWTKDFGSSAAGRYQFMNATLKGFKKSKVVSGTELLDAGMQDRLALVLLNGRGYSKFMAGTMTLVAFGLGLAKEWASFPALADCKGSSRQVKRGQSYYAGDGLNKALVAPETVEACLASMLHSDKAVAAVDAKPTAVEAVVTPAAPAATPLVVVKPTVPIVTMPAAGSIFTKLGQLLDKLFRLI